jgi:deazaflavin-dependent oxidoreductase (nitroreductase family)
MSVVASVYRVTGGRSGRSALLLTTVGAKSGEERTASLRRFDEGSRQWLVVGSAGGSVTHPAWVYNLAANPDKVWAEVGRGRFKVRPELLAGDERGRAWARILAEAPQFAAYETTTDRAIPVFRLTADA